MDPAVEEEWNRWYNDVHVPEIVSCPGFLTASRYVSEVDGKRYYLSVYELESEETVRGADFAKRRGWYRFADKVEAKVRVYSRIFSTEAT